MKIIKVNAGALTNFEVYDFLHSRGAKADPMSCIGAAMPSECKVFEYLQQTPACTQTKEAIVEFCKRSEAIGEFKIVNAEKINIVNLRPSSQALLYPLIDECEKRLKSDEATGVDPVQDLLDLVLEILPPPPSKLVEETENQEETQEEQLVST